MRAHYIDLESGVWEDDLGKHLRFSATDPGVAITIDILPIDMDDDEAADQQASALMSMMVALPGMVADALDRALNDHGPECDCSHG